MKRTLAEVNTDAERRYQEMAKNPNHPSNLKMIAFFEERRKKLEAIKNATR